MFEHVKPSYLEDFQKINAEISKDDSLINILKHDLGVFYRLTHVLETNYISTLEAVHCLRNIYKHLSDAILPLYGFTDEAYRDVVLLWDDIDAARDFVWEVEFHFADLNNYVREAQLIHHNRKKAFQCPDDVRRSIALIGMAYVELAGGPQMEFIPPTPEDIMWMEHAVSEYHTSEFIATGLCRMVWDWRREGKTEREIAELLYDNGKWCSLAQIGALLHNNDTRISADSMKKYASRLLGKSKE